MPNTPALKTSAFRISNLESNRLTRHSTLDTRHSHEAARSFEKVLVKQFVDVLTEQMFKSNLAGDQGPGWMKAYGDTQRQVLSDVLTDHLVDNGTFRLSELVLQQWRRAGMIEQE